MCIFVEPCSSYWFECPHCTYTNLNGLVVKILKSIWYFFYYQIHLDVSKIILFINDCLTTRIQERDDIFMCLLVKLTCSWISFHKKRSPAIDVGFKPKSQLPHRSKPTIWSRLLGQFPDKVDKSHCLICLQYLTDYRFEKLQILLHLAVSVRLHIFDHQVMSFPFRL